MTLAHSSPPCSQMCRFSCPWTTPPCTSLSPLTWGCPCVAWRFSTNHWPLTSTTSRLLIPPARPPLPTSSLKPNRHHYFLFPTVPRPSTSCGTSCAWQVGVQTLFLCSDPPYSLSILPYTLSTFSLPRLVRRQCIPPLFSNECLHLHVFSPMLVSSFALDFQLI